MTTIRDAAIVLRHWDFSETSQTVSVLTREHGVIRGLAKGAKRERGAFSGGIDVLTRGQIVAIVKRGRDLATVTEWHLEDPCRAVRQRLEANRAAMLMVDAVHHLLDAQDPHRQLFDALAGALDGLGAGAAPGPLLVVFLWCLLEEAGYRPQLDHDVRSGGRLPDAETLGFDPAAGGLVPAEAAPPAWRLRRATAALLRAVAAHELPDAADPEVVGRAARLLAAYCREIAGTDLPSLAWTFGTPPG
jgi:DNA repair protein RecO (recombination protein O)